MIWITTQEQMDAAENAYTKASAAFFKGAGDRSGFWGRYVEVVRAAWQLQYRDGLFGEAIKIPDYVIKDEPRAFCRNTDIYRNAIAAISQAKTMEDVRKIITDVDEIQNTDECPCLIEGFSKDPQ